MEFTKEKLVEMEKDYLEWLEERPTIREVACRFRPWERYYYVPSKHIVRIYSYDEHKDKPVSIRMMVLFEDNPNIFMERMVFGVDPKDIVPLDENTQELPYA